MMNKFEAIEFLKHHQPLPDDNELTKEIIDNYDEVRKFFKSNPDEICIPLFLNSFLKRVARDLRKPTDSSDLMAR